MRRVFWAGLSVAAACSGPVHHAPLPPAATYSDFGAQVVQALEQDLWAGGGQWFHCDGACGSGNQDWGSDALTFVLWLRWGTTQDASLLPMFRALTGSAPFYVALSCNGAFCPDWSDMPEWDAVAAAREFEATGDSQALDLAKDAYQHVRGYSGYAQGACPEIRYQRAGGGGGGLKTLETDSNAIKAALLLWKQTGDDSYLANAEATYAAVRTHFLDPVLPLYTAYLFDDGKTCTQLPGRFFGSVNGNMIWNGAALSDATGDWTYLAQATETANGIDAYLSDGRGIYANLLADNDVVEPLVEAFYVLATAHSAGFARDWLLRNADAALRNSRTPDGLYGRFFDGPPPAALVTDWQTNGGMALAVAAASLDPTHAVQPEGDWDTATSTDVDITALPSSLSFHGSGVALLGTLGEKCCEAGHAALRIDGTPTVDGTGIWQNKSSAGQSFDGSILFAWQWPQSGDHTLQFDAPQSDAKEGGPFLHVRSYRVIP